MLHEDVPARATEDVRVLEPRLGHRRPWLVLQLRPVEPVEEPKGRRVEQPADLVDLVGQERELAHQQCPHLVGRLGVELDAHGVASEPATQDGLDRLEQIAALVLLQLEVRVTRQSEHRMPHDLHPGEQDLEVRRDHLLDRDEPLAVGQLDEPREQRRHLDAGEPPHAARGDRAPGRPGSATTRRCTGTGGPDRRTAGSGPGTPARGRASPGARDRGRRGPASRHAEALLLERRPELLVPQVSARALASATRSRIPASCSSGVSPSGEAGRSPRRAAPGARRRGPGRTRRGWS